MAISGLQLRSAYAPEEEAALQAVRAPESAETVTVYGLGLGDLPRRLLARPKLRQLDVVLLNLSVAHAVFEASNQCDWLHDPRVELHYSPGQRRTNEPFCAVPPCLQLADPDNFALRDAITAKLQEPFVTEKWKEREQILFQHIQENKQLVASDGDVGELFGRSPGARFLVVGPGPTLSEGLESIKAQRGDVTLVAISTALQPLILAGMTPDFVIMIDSHSLDPLREDQRLAFQNTPLVYVPDVQNETLATWPGPRFCGYLARARHAVLAASTPRQELWTEGTVAHSAVDFAVQCGASEVVLFGLDFGYPEGESHAKGTPDYQAAGSGDLGRALIDGNGARILSDPNLITYLRDLEDYVRAHPDVTFWRADRRGAEMEGVQWLNS